MRLCLIYVHFIANLLKIFEIISSLIKKLRLRNKIVALLVKTNDAITLSDKKSVILHAI